MKKIILATLAILSVISCNRYLDIEPKGEVIPKSVEDYDLLLNGGNYSMHTLSNESILFLTADDFIYNPSGTIDPGNIDNIDYYLFSFSEQRFANPNTPINAWNHAYSNIYVFNKVTNEVMSSSESVGYAESDKKAILASAQYGRALNYFYLVNTFAKHYSKENLSADGVPLVLQSDVTQVTGKRNTVGEVYDQIISDIEASIPSLPVKSANSVRPNKGSGHALAARIYLYKGDYQKSMEHATKAMQLGSLANYVAEPIQGAYDKEQYSYLWFGAMAGYSGILTPEAKANFDLKKDTRYNKIFKFRASGTEYKIFMPVNQICSVGEMYVTNAENHARLNNTAKAIELLNELRDNRIIDNVHLTTADFPTKDSLLKFIFEERRREMYLSGTRLFDIKRQNLEPQFAKKITHNLNGTQFIAEPNSNKLVLPIPAQVMKYNPTWSQN